MYRSASRHVRFVLAFLPRGGGGGGVIVHLASQAARRGLTSEAEVGSRIERLATELGARSKHYFRKNVTDTI